VRSLIVGKGEIGGGGWWGGCSHKTEGGGGKREKYGKIKTQKPEPRSSALLPSKGDPKTKDRRKEDYRGKKFQKFIATKKPLKDTKKDKRRFTTQKGGTAKRGEGE